MKAIILFTVLSPAIPLIVLYYLAFRNKGKRIGYLLASLIMCALSAIIGSYLADKASGLNGIMYVGFIFGGSLGAIITLVTMFVVFIVDRIYPDEEPYENEK